MKIKNRRIGKEKHLLDCLYEGLAENDEEGKLAMLNFFIEDNGIRITWHPGYTHKIHQDMDRMLKIAEATFLEKRDMAIKFLKKIGKYKEYIEE